MLSTSRSKRASPCSPTSSRSSRFPAMPWLTTHPRSRRRFRTSTERLFAPTVEPTPSNHESPNATATAVSSGARTSTPETKNRASTRSASAGTGAAAWFPSTTSAVSIGLWE
jgi:hypothetical protein